MNESVDWLQRDCGRRPGRVYQDNARSLWKVSRRALIQVRFGRVRSIRLDPDVLKTIKTLDPALQEGQEFLTDLASVPGPTRWFLGAYGEHTPAVLIHDWLIPTPEGLDGMTDAYADRYMRFMLKEAGIRWLKRWVMWAAVALRTRLAAGGGRRLSVIVWIVAAIVGMVAPSGRLTANAQNRRQNPRVRSRT